jgi:hypothetical protein
MVQVAAVARLRGTQERGHMRPYGGGSGVQGFKRFKRFKRFKGSGFKRARCNI